MQPRPYPRPVPWSTSLLVLAAALAMGFTIGNLSGPRDPGRGA